MGGAGCPCGELGGGPGFGYLYPHLCKRRKVSHEPTPSTVFRLPLSGLVRFGSTPHRASELKGGAMIWLNSRASCPCFYLWEPQVQGKERACPRLKGRPRQSQAEAASLGARGPVVPSAVEFPFLHTLGLCLVLCQHHCIHCHWLALWRKPQRRGVW